MHRSLQILKQKYPPVLLATTARKYRKTYESKCLLLKEGLYKIPWLLVKRTVFQFEQESYSLSLHFIQSQFTQKSFTIILCLGLGKLSFSFLWNFAVEMFQAYLQSITLTSTFSKYPGISRDDSHFQIRKWFSYELYKHIMQKEAQKVHWIYSIFQSSILSSCLLIFTLDLQGLIYCFSSDCYSFYQPLLQYKQINAENLLIRK